MSNAVLNCEVCMFFLLSYSLALTFEARCCALFVIISLPACFLLYRSLSLLSRPPFVMQLTAPSSLSWVRTQCALCSPSLSTVRVGLSRSLCHAILRLRCHLLAEYEQSVSFGLLVRCSSGLELCGLAWLTSSTSSTIPIRSRSVAVVKFSYR